MKGELLEAGAVAFHLQALSPFVMVGPGHARLEAGSDADAVLDIEAEWAVEASQAPDLVDYRQRPVYHLVLRSGPVDATFALETRFRITWPSSQS